MCKDVAGAKWRLGAGAGAGAGVSKIGSFGGGGGGRMSQLSPFELGFITSDDEGRYARDSAR